ncbi:inter-alpha-trypsin inhibitor heavy chain H3-like [Denticeps clupeoides]|uniref:inter-alpha-trypsin inhibitor heavy chain H3-like n=1 Tax=Denticeps clupeoides TaxID=299321 RepID=UPI0010A563C6|nr:inter-alpha-trypsin inhibitor heavy chain H3-like [Denticeps clupeoides]
MATTTADWDIYSFHINSTVTSRYATSVISSRVANRHNNPTEILFHVKIPKNAFISKFRMTIDGKIYDGEVRKKEEVQQQYSQAVSQGQSAGLIISVGRTLEHFKTSVTVAAHKKVDFELTYEELLSRRLGKYELLINAQPMQPVKDFRIGVNIYETTGIRSLNVKGSLKDLAHANRADQKAWINFHPTLEQQTQCDGCRESGLNGDMHIFYDVERPESLGEVMTSNGFFAHYFAPSDIPRIPKNVIFIIDESGSMMGKKIQQTQSALLKILDDINEDDYFGLIIFSSRIRLWKPELLPATEDNIEAAKSFVKNLDPNGGTDINSAVLKGVEMINACPREEAASILILLTDGDPTAGVTNRGQIQHNVKAAIGLKFPLYILGFGFDITFEFLQKLSQENGGMARRIYTDSDAALQLQGFYEEVSTPLLTNIRMNYTGVTSITKTSFSRYYDGSEIVVAGEIIRNSSKDFSVTVMAISKLNNVMYQDLNPKEEKHASGLENSLQRVWAFLTVKQLLEKELTAKGKEKEAVRKQVLELSLKYKFVTPLTSMVVTKPQGEDAHVANKPKEDTEEKVLLNPFNNRGLSRRPTSDQIQSRHHGRLGRPSSIDIFDMSEEDGHSWMTSPLWIKQKVNMRFLVAAQGLFRSLCYDIPGGLSLRLFHEPTSGFSMNGQLMPPTGKGFQKIKVHLRSDERIYFDTNQIQINIGQSNITLSWINNTKHETDNITVTVRDKEVEVILKSIRIAVLLHQRYRKRFLWPAVRNRPSGTTVSGILGHAVPIVCEYTQDSKYKIKIGEQEVDAYSTEAYDYGIHAAPAVYCLYVPPEAVLQKNLSDFTVLHL